LAARLLDRINGTRLSVGHHHPFLVDDPRRIWLVLEGGVDLFAVPLREGRVAGIGTHLLHIDAGELIFGLQPIPDLTEDGTIIGLHAITTMGTELFGADRDNIAGDDFDNIVVDWIDRWIDRLADVMAPVGGPRSTAYLEADPGVPVDAGGILVPQRGDVIWVRLDSGTAVIADCWPLTAGDHGAWLPLARNLWLTCETGSVISGIYTPTALYRKTLWSDLDGFHALFMRTVAERLQQRRDITTDRLARKAGTNRAVFNAALRRIGAILLPVPGDTTEVDTVAGDDPLYEAARLVGAASGLAIVPPIPGRPRTLAYPLDELARRSHIRTRRVVLFDDWFRRDNGPLLAWRSSDQQPVALLPERQNRYRLVDPGSGTARIVTSAVAETLTGVAHILYPPFPARALRIREVLAFGLRGQRQDGTTLFVMGLLSGLLALATPIATGKLFSSIIPRADLDMHLMVIAGLVLSAFGTAAFAVTRGFAALRIQSRMDARIQTAVWDRLLALPVPFFRDYTAGDLADRANGISLIRELLSGTATQAVLNVVFSLFSLILLFWYSWELALVAQAVVLGMLLLSFAVTWMQLPLQREMIARGGKIEGLIFQLLAGLSKLRISASEPRAFARWAEQFSTAKELTYRIRRLAALQSVLTAMFPLFASIVLFATIGFGLNMDVAGRVVDEFGVGAFLSFNAAFGQFSAAMLGLLGSLTVLIAIVPLYERVRPILETIPEVSDVKVDPGPLDGTIELSRILFRYAPDAPPALDDVSVLIPSGGYVAFVGASGSGKSTLIRLLLGFEHPESGGVYLDGKDLSGLDLPAVRRQIGVVLQNGRIMPGSLFDNIVGSLPLTQNDAWEAARMAGLADDIKAMPMGMHTVLSEGAGTLSGGERQRLMIARALVHKPRILILDEATSALDNRTQKLVNTSLARMNMTRIVVAHRLSTIQDLDKIFVMSQGRIVEAGDFRSLMTLDGEFAALARRQMF
jgi:ATP-binding cassette subfamily C protein